MPTSIEWVRNPDGTKGETWNPVTGCTKISAGCKNCYAERMSKRLAGRYGYPVAPHNFDVTLHPDKLNQPLRWKKARRIFVASMGDLFHENVSFEYIDAVFAVMWVATHHTFLVLTKRPERMQSYIKSRVENRVPIGIAWRDTIQFHKRGLSFSQHGWNWRGYVDLCSRGTMPLSNLCLGVTVESPDQLWRIDHLLQTPAVMRFVSVEPMLSEVYLAPYLPLLVDTVDGPQELNALRMLDLVICGAETGPGARPMDLDWGRDLRDQCISANVPFFFKRDSDGNRELDGRLWEQWPGEEDGDGP